MDKEEKQKRGQMEREKSMQRWRLREKLSDKERYPKRERLADRKRERQEYMPLPVG